MTESNCVYLGCIPEGESISYPSTVDYFSPSEHYPEYKFDVISDSKNNVYSLVREGFRRLNYDIEHYGSDTWNPLSSIIKPGDVVVIKPNMVKHVNAIPEYGIECVLTHPSLVRAVIDYVLIALNNSGQVIVADAPVQECDFEVMKEVSGYNSLFNFYAEHGISIPCVDLRNHKSRTKHGVNIQQEREKTNETVIVDLKGYSEFSNLPQTRYSKLRITNYNPDIMQQHHSQEKNEYAVASSILNANVIINMPKPKTHRYAGLTLSLKNMVGINTNKDYLPHHTLHSIEQGGDAYKSSNCFKRLLEYVVDLRNRSVGNKKYMLGSILTYFSYGIGILGNISSNSNDNVISGNWYGNDTIWRTILDLNRVVRYADKAGLVQSTPQRKIFNIADMIISGEKEGPLSPSPKKVGVIAMSDDAVSLDETLATMMGINKQYIPTIRNASAPHLLSIGNGGGVIVSNNEKWNGRTSDELLPEDCFSFELTSGWKDYLGE